MNGWIGSDAPVVVGVEPGEAMAQTVAWAADAAVRRGRPLVLVHVVDQPYELFRADHDADSYGAAYVEAGHQELSSVHALEWSPRGYGDPGPGTGDLRRRAHSLEGRVHAAGSELLSRACALAEQQEPGIEVRGQLEVGDTRAQLARQARKAALLVIGTRSLSTVAELLTAGPIAAPLTAHAHCPVAVIRPRVEPAAERPFVVVGIDGSEGSSSAVAFAFAEAAARRAELVAVLVNRTIGPGLHMQEEQRAREGWLRLSGTLAGWTDKYPDVPVRGQVLAGNPAQVLAGEARQALEVVVGTRGRGGFAGLGLGSVGHGLIHHAPCPVVVVPRGAA